MSQGCMKTGYKLVKPILSLDSKEAHSRVLGLYRAYYRYIPYIIKYFDVPKTHYEIRMKLREHFYKNRCVQDVRVIDTLVIKGYMELKEITHQWQQKGHIMAHWCPTYEMRPKDFVSKFIESNE